MSNYFVILPDILFLQRIFGVGVPSLDSPLCHHHSDTQYCSTAFSVNAAAVVVFATEVARARELHAEQQQQQERTWSVHYMQGIERALRSFAMGGTPAAAVSAAAGAAPPPSADEAPGAVAAPAAGGQQQPASIDSLGHHHAPPAALALPPSSAVATSAPGERRAPVAAAATAAAAAAAMRLRWQLLRGEEVLLLLPLPGAGAGADARIELSGPASAREQPAAAQVLTDAGARILRASAWRRAQAGDVQGR